jgi:hypothetical protein
MKILLMNINANRQRFQLFIVELADNHVETNMPLAARFGCLGAVLWRGRYQACSSGTARCFVWRFAVFVL